MKTNTYTQEYKCVVNSPINLTGMNSWNGLSSHILHTTDVTGNGFTGDGWTALIREKLRLRGQLFAIWTSTELISILEVNEWRMQRWSSTLKQNIWDSSPVVNGGSGRNKDVNCVILTSSTL